MNRFDVDYVIKKLKTSTKRKRLLCIEDFCWCSFFYLGFLYFSVLSITAAEFWWSVLLIWCTIEWWGNAKKAWKKIG